MTDVVPALSPCRENIYLLSGVQEKISRFGLPLAIVYFLFQELTSDFLLPFFQTIISNLLDWSRLESGSLQAESIPFSLRDGESSVI